MVPPSGVAESPRRPRLGRHPRPVPPIRAPRPGGHGRAPPSARAALAARAGPHQRVVLAVHFRISQSDEWADKGHIARGGPLYRSIRDFERRTVPAVDGLVFVSSWARSSLHQWMSEAAGVPGVVIPNFVRTVPE